MGHSFPQEITITAISSVAAGGAEQAFWLPASLASKNLIVFWQMLYAEKERKILIGLPKVAAKIDRESKIVLLHVAAHKKRQHTR